MSVNIDFTKDSPLTKEMRKNANKALNEMSKDIHKKMSQLYWGSVDDFYRKETLQYLKETTNKKDRDKYGKSGLK